MSSSRLVWVLAAVALAMSGCGGGSSLPIPGAKTDGAASVPTSEVAAKKDGSGSVPLSGLAAKLAEDQCQYQVRCGVYPDLATCKESWTDDVGHLVASVNAGRMQYDGGAAAACLDIVRGVGCNKSDQPDNPPLACANTFRGLVAEGAACFEDLECVSGSCDLSSCSGDLGCCPGTCEPGPAVASPVAAGGDCSPASATCGDGARCTFSSATNRMTCVVGIKLGEGCDPHGGLSGDCLSHAQCRASASGLGGTCLPLPATGEACSLAGECNSSKDFCDSWSDRCVPKILPGQPCTDFASCVDYAVCDTVNGRCVPRRKLGEACDSTPTGDCMADLDCANGVCAKRDWSLPVCP